jgi:CYTH domain-containing protein
MESSMKTIDEFERRFIPSTLEWMEFVVKGSRRKIRQGYPPRLQEPGKFARVRETDYLNGSMSFERCDKGLSNQASSPETEWAVEKVLTDSLLNECGLQQLVKFREDINWPKCLIVNVDQFEWIRDQPSMLVIIEPEFNSLRESLSFEPPKWFGTEITGIHKWSNYGLCINGEPKY